MLVLRRKHGMMKTQRPIQIPKMELSPQQVDMKTQQHIIPQARTEDQRPTQILRTALSILLANMMMQRLITP